jgi:teichuronic acid biosynthesis glycosyltransferase TuaC
VSSVGEGWPNVIFEAMICNKPVIATSVGGIPEAICSSDYGLLVPPKDPAAMSDAMQRALDMQWCRGKIAQYAKDNSWTKVGEKYNQIYRELWFAHGQARK